MMGFQMTFHYEAFGFNIRSEIPLPELPIGRERRVVDLEIRKADLSPMRELVADPRRRVHVEQMRIWFQIPDTATFCIESGTTILVSPLGMADWDKIRLYLLGSCMGFILMQRKILPLHGSVIKIGDQACAIVGDSGAGKSTLATFLVQQGCPLLTDDLIAVRWDERMRPMASPSYPQQKLWAQSLHLFDMDPSDYRPLFDRETKYAVPVSQQFYERPAELGAVIELVKSETDRAQIRKLQGLEGIHALFRQTFRNTFISRLGLEEWHFQTTVRLMESIGVYQLVRPAAGCSVMELAEIVLDLVERRNRIEYKSHSTL